MKRMAWAAAVLSATAAAFHLGGVPVARATSFTQDLDFEAVNRNPFAQGQSYFDVYEQAIPLPTQRTDFPALVLPLAPPSPYPQVSIGAAVTGAMNLDFWAGVNTGRLNINYPLQAAFDVPDGLTVGQSFSLGSSATVLPAGYSQMILVPAASFSGIPYYLTAAQIASGAPSLTTSNPGISAGVDFNITNHNFLYVQGCATPLSITCADIVNEQLPSVGSQTITLISASTLGNVQILPDIPGATQTFSLPQTIPLGTFASFTVNKPDLSQNGALVGSALQASKTSNVATLTLDIDQLLSNTLLNPLLLPPLTGNVGPVGYSLLDANASLLGGLYQNLDFTVTDTKVTLVFDHYVRAIVNGVDRGAVLALDFNAGDDVQLKPMGFVTKLHVVPTFTLENNLHNSTGIALQGELDAKALSASLGVLGSTGYLVDGTFTVPLGQFELYHNDFSVDIKQVLGDAFDIDFGLDARLTNVEVGLSELTEGPDGSATFRFNLLRDNALIASFDVSGKVQRLGPCGDLISCGAFFLPDQEVFAMIDGESVDLGDIFCWAGTCFDAVDLSPLESLVHTAVVDGFDPVYFADAGQDFLVSDALPTDDFTSHFSSTPDPGQVYAFNPEFYDRLLAVPEPGSLELPRFRAGRSGCHAPPPVTPRRRQTQGAPPKADLGIP